MSAAFWKVFELAISVWENILLLEFCMDFMQQKPRGKKGKILWGIAVLFGLIFPALEKYPALYDRWEMWITLIWLFVYLMVGTRGSVLRKVTAAVVARAVLMMVNTAILFGGSFVLQESVASFIQDQDTVRIALVLLSKIQVCITKISTFLILCDLAVCLATLYVSFSLVFALMRYLQGKVFLIRFYSPTTLSSSRAEFRLPSRLACA